MSSKKDSTLTFAGKPCFESRVYQVGDQIIFKYEGNIRARVEGQEIVDGRVWLACHALLDFKVPRSQVIGVEEQE